MVKLTMFKIWYTQKPCWHDSVSCCLQITQQARHISKGCSLAKLDGRDEVMNALSLMKEYCEYGKVMNELK
jgi:hypothetical protein